MKTISVTALVLLLSRNVVADAVADPAEAAVTQAAQLVKRDASVYGWYSAGFTGGTTICTYHSIELGNQLSDLERLTMDQRECANG